MSWITDSLASTLEKLARLNPLNRGDIRGGAYSHDMAMAAYMSSGMMRKVITIPAEDRVREWRDWQAEAKVIEAIEAEERRLGLQAKVLEAETLRGIGGGALIIVTAGDHASPLTPDQIRKGGIAAINVVSRWQISGKDWDRELASPGYGIPRMWTLTGGDGRPQDIHPSRVITFRGARLPVGSAISDEDAYWGDNRLLRVHREVERSDNAQGWFAALVKKAKLLRFGISGMSDRDQDKLEKRVQLIATGESALNAVLYELPGEDGRGEKIDDYQVNWTGIPAMMDAFDQRIAAVADIPFTRLMGRSPAGMNSTGAYDDLNWVKAVMTGQKLELRPCLEALDSLLLRSAGVSPEGIWWEFAPLSAPTEKEKADTFSTIMGAVEKLQATATIPDREFAMGVQNLAIENGWLPGLDAELAKLPDDERYGLVAEVGEEDEPSALDEQPGSMASDGGSRTSDRPFLDSKQRRHPAGTRRGGQFAASGSASIGASQAFAASVRPKRDDTRVHRVGAVNNAAAIKSATGHDVTGFTRIVPASGVQHTLKGHGAGSPKLKPGERPVRPRDIGRVAHRLGDASAITARGKISDGSGVRFEHRVPVGKRTAVYVERMGRRDKQLRFVTMWWGK